MIINLQIFKVGFYNIKLKIIIKNKKLVDLIAYKIKLLLQ